MASTDAKPVPQKNVAYRVVFPILDADGDLVTGATGLDSEISKDQGTFADCTNEATEIATSSGVYYLDLTNTEMNADCVAIIVKTTTVGAKTTVLVLYPEEAGDIRVNVTQFGGANGTFASGRPEVNTTHWNGTAVTTPPAVNATQISGDATAADNLEAALDGTGGVTLGVTLGTDAIPASAIAASAITAAKIATDAITAAKIAADAVTEIQSGLATAGALATVDGIVDTIVATTDKLDDTLEDDGGTFRFTANALEQAPTGSGGGLDAAGVRAAVGLASANLDAQLGTIDANVDTILVDTAEIGAAGAGLSAIPWNAAWDAEVQSEAADALAAYDPPTRTEATADKDEILTAVDDVPTNAELTVALAAADDAVLAAIAALNNLSAAQVASEIADALSVDARAELAAPPAANAPLSAKITWLAMLARNKIEQTASAQTVYADNESTPVAEAVVSDDGTTATRAEFAAP